ncbi:hypothetical protein ACVC7V_15180 [Hydrogenophaga sp. A37]|uniref:hypothetical protein n=1 Tax=Hydrogenophaga sp. A37 TaxID=1945864 RepID=UPI00098764D3|nr:hypothetical protein [Hydrogenophaga sp. A37]OOG86274.1 hypothetical protein B0E41_06455 [Hydrogenophaga sp. A37]
MLIKTEKGRQELRVGHRSLGQRERAILLLADGQTTEASLATLFGGDGRALLDRLLSHGFIERKGAHAPAPVPRAAPAVAHGDPFAGTRSLATARMFLFDLSERLFAPRDKTLALHYREALREARDAGAMLTVGRAMIVDVERLAGSQRADGISERLAKLLPADLLLDMA